MNWVLIVAGVIFVSTIVLGYSRGFLKTIFGISQMIVTIVLVLIVSPILKDILRENTDIYNQARDSVMVAIESNLPDLSEGFTVPEELENELIDKIVSAELIQDLLKKNNTPDVYESMGVSSFAEYIGSYMAELVLAALSFIISFIVVLIALQIVSLMFDIIGKLPLLGEVNQLAGGLLGAAEGLLVLWLLCLLVTAFSDTEVGAEVLLLISSSPILSAIYNNNLILQLMIMLGLGI